MSPRGPHGGPPRCNRATSPRATGDCRRFSLPWHKYGAYPGLPGRLGSEEERAMRVAVPVVGLSSDARTTLQRWARGGAPPPASCGGPGAASAWPQGGGAMRWRASGAQTGRAWAGRAPALRREGWWLCQPDLAPFDGLIWPHPHLVFLPFGRHCFRSSRFSFKSFLLRVPPLERSASAFSRDLPGGAMRGRSLSSG